MTRPWQTLAAIPTAEGELALRRRGTDEFLILVGGRVLMNSHARRSEEELGRLAAPKGPNPRVLLGGLGMGCTLRALLDALPGGARVDVVELTPAIVEWCRGPLAALTAGATMDPRVNVRIGDVAHAISGAAPRAYDAIVLDLYEGPYTSTQPRDHAVFGEAALRRAQAALAPGGVLAIWGEDDDRGFAARLEKLGFRVRTEKKGGGRTHVIYLASSSGGEKKPV